MQRRTIVGILGTAGVALGSDVALADHTDEHHEQHAHRAAGSALAAAARDCVATADACLAHCVERLGAGDRDLEGCARTVIDVRAVCEALATLAAQNSPLLPKYAAVAHEACKACETECRRHDKHQPCKECAEACARCATECARFVRS